MQIVRWRAVPWCHRQVFFRHGHDGNEVVDHHRHPLPERIFFYFPEHAISKTASTESQLTETRRLEPTLPSDPSRSLGRRRRHAPKRRSVLPTHGLYSNGPIWLWPYIVMVVAPAVEVELDAVQPDVGMLRDDEVADQRTVRHAGAVGDGGEAITIWAITIYLAQLAMAPITRKAITIYLAQSAMAARKKQSPSMPWRTSRGSTYMGHNCIVMAYIGMAYTLMAARKKQLPSMPWHREDQWPDRPSGKPSVPTLGNIWNGRCNRSQSRLEWRDRIGGWHRKGLGGETRP